MLVPQTHALLILAISTLLSAAQQVAISVFKVPATQPLAVSILMSCDDGNSCTVDSCYPTYGVPIHPNVMMVMNAHMMFATQRVLVLMFLFQVMMGLHAREIVVMLEVVANMTLLLVMISMHAQQIVACLQ